MVLTVSFALSPVTGLVCHRHRRNHFRRLDTSVGASGPHDFAVRLTRRSSAALSASTASRPAAVTIACRPSVGRNGGGYRSDLGQEKTGIFLREGWTPVSRNSPTRLGKNGGRFRELMYDSVYDESYVQDR